MTGLGGLSLDTRPDAVAMLRFRESAFSPNGVVAPNRPLLPTGTRTRTEGDGVLLLHRGGGMMRGTTPRWLWVILPVAFVLTSITSEAQSGRGTISGRVKDASGSVVPGVAVSATHR